MFSHDDDDTDVVVGYGKQAEYKKVDVKMAVENRKKDEKERKKAAKQQAIHQRRFNELTKTQVRAVCRRSSNMSSWSSLFHETKEVRRKCGPKYGAIVQAVVDVMQLDLFANWVKSQPRIGFEYSVFDRAETFTWQVMASSLECLKDSEPGSVCGTIVFRCESFDGIDVKEMMKLTDIHQQKIMAAMSNAFLGANVTHVDVRTCRWCG